VRFILRANGCADLHRQQCAWNVLFRQGIDLYAELPPSDFRLLISREIEIELEAIPDVDKNGADKRPLKQYIRETIARCGVHTTSTFGFSELGGTSGPQRFGGFNQGTFQSNADRDWYARPENSKLFQGKTRPGRLASSRSGISFMYRQAYSIAAAPSRKCSGKLPVPTGVGIGCPLRFRNSNMRGPSIRSELRSQDSASARLNRVGHALVSHQQ
jgi:hypothetical protein